MTTLRSAGFCSAAIITLGLLFPNARADDSALPPNIDHSLRRIIDWHQTEAVSRPVSERRALLARSLPAQSHRAQMDATASKVVVNVMLDGTRPLADVQSSLQALGIDVFAQDDRGGAGSILSAHVPLEHAVEASKLAGVQSLNMVRRPKRRVGRATSQGVATIKADQVQASGYTGKGITVGVLSDSYNLTIPGATADVLGGDLPGNGNPQGYTTPVNILQEGDASDSSNTDEGRALLQIVHDVAPGASLAFATVGETPESFAANIRALRTSANCDVLVDDIAFYDEPFFSDGVIAQAIDDVVHSTTLAGKRVAFYSAAGNDSNGLFDGVFDPVSDDTARAGLGNDNLKLYQVPGSLTANGFHNFKGKPNKAPMIVQNITVYGTGSAPASDGSDDVFVDFQWDDAFNARQMTTDYNILVFDIDGNYLKDLSGTDNNFSTGEPAEYADLPPGANGEDVQYQLVITRGAGGSGAATHLRSLADSEVLSYLADKFAKPSTPSIFGHVGAPGVDGVAAYDYTFLNEPEEFSSVGPMTVYLDRNGNRLATPDVRQQPTMAGPDGVDTSFFPAGSGQDSDGDGLPNFFGTSAAAPHVAGAAALLLQAAGGPSSLTSDQLRALLQGSAGPHDLDPSFSAASITTADGLASATLSATGDGSNRSVYNSQFFELTYNGPSTRSIKKVIIDLSAAGLEFDTSVGLGYPFSVGTGGGATITSSEVTPTFSGPTDHPNVLTLKFAAGVFLPGNTFFFGVDRDDTSTDAGGNSADVLAGATVSLRTVDTGIKSMGSGVFANEIGIGNTDVDGYGLINAEAALQLLLTGH